MLKEFKEFAFGGNLIEIATGLVLALAFATLVGSLVENIITPIIAAIVGQPDFSSLTIDIGDAQIFYGSFLNALITFLSVAAAVFFFLVKPYKAYLARRAAGEVADEEAPPPPEDVQLLREIRDALRTG